MWPDARIPVLHRPKTWRESDPMSKFVLGGICVVLLTLSTSTFAGSIVSIADGVGPGHIRTNIGSIDGPEPNNDGGSNPLADPDFTNNFFYYTLACRSTHPTNGIIDLVFTVSQTGGTSEYDVIADLQLEPGNHWPGVMLMLGTGTGGDFTAFTGAGTPDFDTPTRNSVSPISNDMAVTTHDAHLIMIEPAAWSMPVSFLSLNFSLDIPDVDHFTIRHMPIPEPTTLLLAVAGLTTVGRRPRCSQSCDSQG